MNKGEEKWFAVIFKSLSEEKQLELISYAAILLQNPLAEITDQEATG